MSIKRQKIIFQGPLAQALYQALEQHQAQYSQEQLDESSVGVSLIREGEGGSRLVVQARTPTTIVVYGTQAGATTAATQVAEFVSLATSAKSSTSVRLLVLGGDDGEYTAQIRECAQALECATYTSVAAMIQELMA